MGKRFKLMTALMLAAVMVLSLSSGIRVARAEGTKYTVAFENGATGAGLTDVTVWEGNRTKGTPVVKTGSGYSLENGTYSYKASNGETVNFGTFTVAGAGKKNTVNFRENKYFPVNFYDYEKTNIPLLNGASESVVKNKLVFYAVLSGTNADTKSMNLAKLIQVYGRQNVNIENEHTQGLAAPTLGAGRKFVLAAPYSCDQEMFGSSTYIGTKNFPFSYNNGVYEYDSNKNHVEYTSGSKLLIYNTASNTITDSAKNAIKVNDGFYPFNSIFYDSTKAPSTGAQGILTATKSMLFGLDMTVDFKLPQSGLDSFGNRLTISVNGDDDIWVYLCGKDAAGNETSELIIDAGGIHGGAVGGSYDLTAEYLRQLSGAGTLKTKLTAGNTYSYKIFYNERGFYYSRLRIAFTAPQEAPVPPTPTPTDVPTPTPTNVPTPTPTNVPTPTPTNVPTPTPTNVPMPTPTDVPTPTPTNVPTPTPTDVPTPTPTNVPTPTPIDVPVVTPTPIEVPTATPTPTDVPVVTPTPIEVPTATPTPIDVPVVTPTPIEVPTATPTPIDVPVVTPTPIEVPTATPTPIDVPTATPTPFDIATPTPFNIVTATPTPIVIGEPTPTPIDVPTATPTPTPEAQVIPTATPTPVPEEIEYVPETPEGTDDDDPTPVPENVDDPEIPSSPDEPEPVDDEDNLPKTGTLPYDTIVGIGAGLVAVGGMIFGKGRKRK